MKKAHNQDTKQTNNKETLNPNHDPTEETVVIIGGGNPNLSPDAGKPLI